MRVLLGWVGLVTASRLPGDLSDEQWSLIEHRLEGPAPLHDIPQKIATYYYFAAWRDDGTDQVIHELLHRQVRERARRLEDPTLVVLDAQSVHAAAGVPDSTTVTLSPKAGSSAREFRYARLARNQSPPGT
ncbi:hypothetical protein GCM10012285_27710 [Streptomyces kronopolitis]|uniref:Transposase n=1 Tax=Streptomyces kronopolitis TaxID=1612435 RepID=A0ABQ2JDF6_9ACTN|nr:hypothetical protein GCM10012285_27710 [Streptomyces kronopolitis]